jgi:adenylate kinase family enzyme
LGAAARCSGTVGPVGQEHELPAARRILVYGVTGSGKTTLARRLGQLTGLPWHSVDDLTWEPGWVPVPFDEQRRRFAAICAEDGWILDTAYSHWIDVALARAELIVALDYPRLVSLGRLLRRTLNRLVDQKPICNGNRESWRNLFSSNSILRWHFRSFPRKRRRIAAWCQAPPPGASVYRFQTPRDLEAWLARTFSRQ